MSVDALTSRNPQIVAGLPVGWEMERAIRGFGRVVSVMKNPA
jgi:hypothetical protein